MQTSHGQDLGGMDAWSRHQSLIKNYVKHYQKSGEKPHEETNYKTERDILVENHRFLRSEEDNEDLTWEKRVAKKYYDKLFKEYALVELKYYQEGRIAMRWRNENEVFRGKGQFTCGSLRCDESKGLQSWEVNFGYVEQGEKKNALVKIRLCEKCSYKLNYKTMQKRAVSTQQESVASEPHGSSSKRKRSSRSGSADDHDNPEEEEKNKETAENVGSKEQEKRLHPEDSDSRYERSRKLSRGITEESGSSRSTNSHRRHGKDRRQSRSRERESRHKVNKRKRTDLNDGETAGDPHTSETGALKERPKGYTTEVERIFKGLFE
ncbi:folate-sensitive fragile site protein Fra10Ac1-domain-containing protein [Dissophora ornata]|nr:folate-sensitive fragile site protein Fra10Ac1-domain-containing protein [Dissophora ornata]